MVSQFFLKQKELDLASEMLGYEEVKFNCTLSESKDKREAREAPRMQNWGMWKYLEWVPGRRLRCFPLWWERQLF